MKNVKRKLSAGMAGNDRQILLLSVSLVAFVLYDEWIRTCLLQLQFYVYPFVIKMKVSKYWKKNYYVHEHFLFGCNLYCWIWYCEV